MDPIIKEIKNEEIPLDFEYKGSNYYGVAVRLARSCPGDECVELDIILNNKYLGSIYCDKDFKCTMSKVFDSGLIKKLAEQIMLWHL